MHLNYKYKVTVYPTAVCEEIQPGKKAKKTKIRITKDNQENLEKYLKEANGKAIARVATLGDLGNLIDYAEDHLQKYGAAKKSWKGTVAEYQESVGCNSYGYSADATLIRVERGADYWFLTKAVRCNTRTARGSREYAVQPSETALQSAVDRLKREMSDTPL